MGLGWTRILTGLVLLAAALAVPAPASASSAQCRNLEIKLARLDRAAPRRQSPNFTKWDGMVHKQQAALDRARRDARRLGCRSTGFAVFKKKRHASCGSLDKKISKMQRNLAKLERRRGRYTAPRNSNGKARRRVLSRMAQLNCGVRQQNARAKRRKEPDRSVPGVRSQGGLFGLLFGNRSNRSRVRVNGRILGRDGTYTNDRGIRRYDLTTPLDEIYSPPGSSSDTDYYGYGSYRTLCVRSCDGYYFPISFDTSSNNLERDSMICGALCPVADAQLYYHRTGEDSTEMVSMEGSPYSEHPAAYSYRTKYDSSCTCKAPGTRVAARDLYTNGTLRPSRVSPVGITPIRKSLPVPSIRPVAGEDPDTVINMAGGFDPQDMMKKASEKNVAAAEERKIRVVGPSYIYKSN